MIIEDMTRVFVLTVFLGLQFLFADCSNASEECVFDKNYFKEDTYKKNSNVESIIWDKENNSASVLTTEGDLIRIQHWACQHLGLQAVMLLGEQDLGDEVKVKEKIQTLLELVLPKADINEAKAELSKMKCLQGNKCRRQIGIKNYTDFYIQTKRQQVSITVLMKYYIN